MEDIEQLIAEDERTSLQPFARSPLNYERSAVALDKQFDVLKIRVNAFLDAQKGERTVEKTVVVKEPYHHLELPSLKNGFGVAWWFRARKKQQGVRVVHKKVQEKVARTSYEGINELHTIVDGYIETYKHYANHITRLCHERILPALKATHRKKLDYYKEVLAAQERAEQAKQERAQTEALQETCKRKFAECDRRDAAYVDLEAEADMLALKLTKYTSACTAATKEAASKRQHANILKFIEYGLYVIHDGAKRSAQTVRECVRQLEDMRSFSQLTTDTVQELVRMDEKIAEGRPYVQESNNLLMHLLGLTFADYNGRDHTPQQDPAKLIEGIQQYQQRTGAHYRETELLLASMRNGNGH